MLSAFTLALSIAAPAGPAQHASGPIRVETAHYDLSWAGTPADADEAARVLEQAFGEMAIFFGAKPDPEPRLRVKVFANETERMRGAWADDITIPSQSRFASYSDVTRTVYVARLGGPAATRQALLYGACLQFHSLCKPKNLDIARTWYAAGIALDFARATWDGERLRPFARPLVEPVDLPGQALARFPAQSTALPSLADAEPADPLIAWATVAMCLHQGRTAYKNAFQRYALGETGSKLSGDDFLRTLGPPKTLARDLRAFLLETQTPFEAVGDWEDRGAAGLTGTARKGEVAFCVLRESNARLSARMGALPRLGSSAGFVVGWYGPVDCALVRIGAQAVEIEVWRLGAVGRTHRLKLPGEPARDRERDVEIRRQGNLYELTVDGTRFEDLELPSGRMGFFVSEASIEFRDPVWSR